jgi:hypothetical protein
MATLPQLRRFIVTVSSDVVATAPAPERLAAIGWRYGEGLSNSRTMIDYYRTTRDGRVVFGRGGHTVSYRNQLSPTFDHSPHAEQDVTRALHHTFPSLRDLPISHAWAGPVERCETGLPVFRTLDRCQRILYGIGYSGNGIAPAVLAGHALAANAAGIENEWTDLAATLNRLPRRDLPPEPVRYLGGRVVRAALSRQEQAEDNGRTPARPLRAITALAPPGIIGLKAPPPKTQPQNHPEPGPYAPNAATTQPEQDRDHGTEHA